MGLATCLFLQSFLSPTQYPSLLLLPPPLTKKTHLYYYFFSFGTNLQNLPPPKNSTSHHLLIFSWLANYQLSQCCYSAYCTGWHAANTTNSKPTLYPDKICVYDELPLAGRDIQYRAPDSRLRCTTPLDDTINNMQHVKQSWIKKILVYTTIPSYNWIKESSTSFSLLSSECFFVLNLQSKDWGC